MTIHRMPRNHLKFDTFDLLAHYGRKKRISLRDPKTLDDFVEQLKDNVTKNLDNPMFLHGQRTESMFEGMVVSLGEIRFLRQEDLGDVFVSDDTLRVPDFLIGLKDGTRLLGEVKNHYPMVPFGDFTLRTQYLNGLISYAALMECQLALAIYWVRLNTWTLVSANAFVRNGRNHVITVESAMKANDMVRLGDLMIATRSPLRLRVISDPAKPRGVNESGNVTFTIGDIELYCADRQILNKTEKQIALTMMLYGDWMENGPTPIISDGQLEAVEFLAYPEEETGQGFEIVGTLSGLFSKYYLSATSEADSVEQTRANFTPGTLGQLIPADYKGDALPLWRFQLMPSVY